MTTILPTSEEWKDNCHYVIVEDNSADYEKEQITLRRKIDFK